MTATLRDVKKAAALIGATVVDDKAYGTHECTVEAPHRYRWADGLHMFVDCTNQPWKPDYQDLLDRMSYGIEPCTDPECDWCNSDEDDQ
jgi:hypothetical protein